MFDAPFAASLELILLRALFLIGTALNEEEREAATDEPEPFCFSGPAQRVGLVDVLQRLVSLVEGDGCDVGGGSRAHSSEF